MSTEVADYARRISTSEPKVALEIAIADANRERALAQKAAAEYKQLSDVEFDNKGRICKASMAGLWRLSQIYASTELVPDHYKGRPNDCFIAVQMAFRLGIDPFGYMQNSYIVHGKPGVEAKLAVGMLNQSGYIRGRIKYEEERDPETKKMTACTAWAIDAESNERVVGPRVDWDMVIAEGWLDKKGSKWKTIPEVMFPYRAATLFIRKFYPDVLLGIQTKDELEDIGPSVDAPKSRTVADLGERLNPNTQTASAAPVQETVTEDGEILSVKTAEKPTAEPEKVPVQTEQPPAQTAVDKPKKKSAGSALFEGSNGEDPARH